ncbi:exonuclease [Vibrio zhanjiangensis]|uniref:Exonuclease n=1 Tax=Vibrio zhanjiangensis TaxID=1046128 RepID=A0ABQ6EYH3_9VIBR|nr:lipid A-modifier LpxR family protein [Vibrio zhanjiangensis]GLT18258.1 exonuclease [Vibrio zhanjiangensis]
MKLKCIITLPLLFSSALALASEKSTLAFSIDNDGIFGVDQDYTNGLFLSYSTGAITPYSLFTPLSLSYWGGASLDKFEFLLGQKMYTPSDIELNTPQVNDRPYAGYLHGEFNYISLHPQQAQRFNLTIGTTGEDSLAEDAQDIVHDIIGSDEPKGWAYQVDDKIVGSVGYLSHFNLWRDKAFSGTDWEISNISEINLGNFRSDISTGLMFRWGTDLAGNMGAANIDAENPFRASMLGASKTGWFVFGGIEARYRFNDITIEGDRSGVDAYAIQNGQNPSIYEVTLDQQQATAVAGIAWYNDYFGATVTASIKTPDYEEAEKSVYSTGGLALYAFF